VSLSGTVCPPLTRLRERVEDGRDDGGHDPKQHERGNETHGHRQHAAYAHFLAQLLSVLATVFGSELSTMIIIFIPDPYWGRRGDLIAFGVKAASTHDQ
jgi:hypothetical protein